MQLLLRPRQVTPDTAPDGEGKAHAGWMEHTTPGDAHTRRATCQYKERRSKGLCFRSLPSWLPESCPHSMEGKSGVVGAHTIAKTPRTLLAVEGEP